MELEHLEQIGIMSFVSCAAPRTEDMAASQIQVQHGTTLEEEYTRRIPVEDQQILRFLLAFLRDEGLESVPVFINGGYVRDLLLGKCPDDLDLSLCLRGCAEDVNVGTLLEKVPGYAAAHSELGVAQVKLATCLSDESKNKNLDTFKAHFTITSGKKIEVDVMPTIGEEVYDGESRIPVRDERGTPEQDTLRRDLTIGAMLLRVAHDGAGGLRYDLLDFYGGLEDLRKGVLRAPYPHEMKSDTVKGQVLRNDDDKELARSLGLDGLPETDIVQVLWWAKILIDDPLRISRALRFAAKLGFELHTSFWAAMPFALQALRTKVAGERKFTEYMKIGGYGFERCSGFFETAFSRAFGPPGAQVRGAPALFGGQDEKRRVRGLSDVAGFDVELYRDLVACFSGVREPSELLGALLACGCFSADFAGPGRDVAEEFTEACGGMSVSNALREAGSSVLGSLHSLQSDPAPADRLDLGFAAALNVAPDALCMHLHAWKALQLPNYRNVHEDVSTSRRALVLKMLRRRAPARFAAVEGCLGALAFARPAVKGGVMDTKGVLQVPGPLRQRVMVLLEVSLRILGVADPLETGDQLSALFDARPAIRDALASSVWYQEDGKTLREEFNPKKDANPKKAKAAKKG